MRYSSDHLNSAHRTRAIQFDDAISDSVTLYLGDTISDPRGGERMVFAQILTIYQEARGGRIERLSARGGSALGGKAPAKIAGTAYKVAYPSRRWAPESFSRTSTGERPPRLDGESRLGAWCPMAIGRASRGQSERARWASERFEKKYSGDHRPSSISIPPQTHLPLPPRGLRYLLKRRGAWRRHQAQPRPFPQVNQ